MDKQNEINVIKSLINDVYGVMMKESWNSMEKICGAAGFAHMFKLSDDLANIEPGYWFFKHSDNLFEYDSSLERTGSHTKKKRGDPPSHWLCSGLLEQLIDGEDLEEEAELYVNNKLIPRAIVELNDKERNVFQEKLKSIEQIEFCLACLLSMVLPGPPIELKKLLYTNQDAVKRSLLVIENNVVLIDSDGWKRYLPWVVGELLLRYLIVFRPLQQLLGAHFQGVNDRMDDYIFAYEWKTKQIVGTLPQHFESCGYDGDFNTFRDKFVTKSCAKFDGKYQKWISNNAIANQEEIDKIHQRFEFQSGFDKLNVELYLELFNRSSIMPFRSQTQT